MELVVRPTTDCDVDDAESCLLDGKKALAALGVPQWQGEYPSRIDIMNDMSHGASYVAADEDGTVLGVMALSFDGDETYDEIDGEWLTESSSDSPTYGVIHRCAVSAAAAHRGVMTAMFAEGERIAREHGMKSMRIDTHAHNLPLQGLAAKCGYERCGVITLLDEDEIDPLRIAFEKVL
ncbi:MAG: GNAT family N-acetyltransferase [Coriobacteriaceae bacterium]|nr:GNAT family N-acetyltransferase [Coriobacteriaceae bacterium]